MKKKDGNILHDTFINKNIKALRIYFNMSQADVFNLLEISRQQYSNIESGYAAASLKHLIKLTEIFGVTLDDLCKSDLSSIDKISQTKIPQKVINRTDNFSDNGFVNNRKLHKKLSNQTLEECNLNDVKLNNSTEYISCNKEQIDTLNRLIGYQKGLLNAKEEVVLTKDELLKSKDAIIEAKEAQIKALTAQLNQFTEKDTQKKSTAGKGTSVASDVVALK